MTQDGLKSCLDKPDKSMRLPYNVTHNPFAVVMNYDTIAVILTVIIGWWALHSDVAQLLEHMVKLEGAMKVLKDLFQVSVTDKSGPTILSNQLVAVSSSGNSPISPIVNQSSRRRNSAA